MLVPWRATYLPGNTAAALLLCDEVWGSSTEDTAPDTNKLPTVIVHQSIGTGV